MSNEKPANKDESFLLQYINAASSAGSRARTIIIVMLVASVFVFTQIRNSDGWLDRRITVRIYALRLIENDKFDSNADIQSKKPEEQAAERLRYERAQFFVTEQGYKVGAEKDKDRLVTQINALTQMRNEQLRLVRLPFFGAAFDANDMGVFAGITFTVVLFWLTLTIHRERRNLQIAFKVAKSQGNLRHCYNLLAMQQILTLPPIKANRYWKPFGYISKALFLLPAGIYLWLFYHEWVTRQTGNALGWDLINSLLGIMTACLAFILVLSTICLVVSFLKDKDWQTYTKQINSLM